MTVFLEMPQNHGCQNGQISTLVGPFVCTPSAATRTVLPVNLEIDSADGNEDVTSKDWHAHSCGRGNVLGL